MKRFLMYLGVFSLLLVPAQGAFAWNGISSLNPLPYLVEGYLLFFLGAAFLAADFLPLTTALFVLANALAMAFAPALSKCSSL